MDNPRLELFKPSEAIQQQELERCKGDKQHAFKQWNVSRDYR